MIKKLLIAGISSLALVGCFHDKGQVPVGGREPVEYIDEQGNVDDMKFEENQSVTDDDSMETIEAELENTVILEEDFSDL